MQDKINPIVDLSEVCPVCEHGALTPLFETSRLHPRDLGGIVISVVMEYSVCDSCGADTVSAQQASRNDQRTIYTKQLVKILAMAEFEAEE